MHLTDGVLLFGRFVTITPDAFEISDPLVLTRVDGPTEDTKVVFSRYDNFALHDGTVMFTKSAIISMYEINASAESVYQNYLVAFRALEEQEFASAEDFPNPPVKETVKTMSESTKPIDVEKLRKEVLKLVIDNTKD